MPRKIRELKSDLKKAGFLPRPGRGSHEVWYHPTVPTVKVTMCKHDGDDAPPYLDKYVREALKQAKGEK
jgi:predicted RNA binding protein YcfA (HicA-like mRNA interferase family)